MDAKKDMSKVCGMHYEEYWDAVHIHKTMTQEGENAILMASSRCKRFRADTI